LELKYSLILITRQGRSQLNTAGGGRAKKFQLGPNIYHLFSPVLMIIS